MGNPCGRDLGLINQIYLRTVTWLIYVLESVQMGGATIYVASIFPKNLVILILIKLMGLLCFS